MTIDNIRVELVDLKQVKDINTYFSLKCISEKMRAKKQLTKPKPAFVLTEPKANRNLGPLSEPN